MKLTVAAGILAQTLPALSEKSNHDVGSFQLRDMISAAKERANNQAQMPHQTRKNRGLTEKRKRNLQELALKNAPGVLPSFGQQQVFCNPDSNDADVGILSCGEGRFCKRSTDSDIGGICMQKLRSKEQNAVDQGTAGKFFRTGPLKNLNSKIQMAPTIECDPESADIGILTCGEGQSCKDDKDSKLGGFCVGTAATSRHLYTVDLCNPASSDFSSSCDCSGLDSQTGTGVIECLLLDDYSIGAVYGGCGDLTTDVTATYNFESSVLTSYQLCYAFGSPSYQKTCLQLAGDTCEIELNDQTCNACAISTSFYTFDCTNVEGGQAGDELFQLFPIVADCYDPTQNVTYSCTQLCGQGDSIAYVNYDLNVTIPSYGEISCGYLAAAQALQLIPDSACPAFSVAAQSGCCEYQCNLCGGVGYIPEANFGNAVEIPIPGYEGITCGDFAYSAYVNFSIPDGTCEAISSIAQQGCCEGSFASCNLCGGEIANPFDNVTIAGYEVPCYFLDSFLNTTECDAIAATVSPTCCGSEPASAPTPGGGGANAPPTPSGASMLLSGRGMASMVVLAASTAAILFTS